ncbi:MAG TPA: hypothetical protein VFQ58_07710, partial [Flavisolibacter sp.]|nr:hypothetical protein [Flavisolibacter sp.]
MLNIRPFRGVNLIHLLTVITLFSGTCSYSQTLKTVSSQVNPASLPPKSSIKFVAGGNKDLFGIRFRFKENVGQYGDTISGYGYMGHVLYGYDGFDMPCLFTEKGLIHLQRKNKQPSHEEKERMEHKGMSKAEIASHSSVVDKIIAAEWEGGNPHPTIETVDPSNGYTTYGLLHSKARAFKKIIYHDLYPGIDVIYSFTGNDKNGFEYTIKVNPGANLSLVKMVYKGDVISIKKKNGILTIASAVNSIQETDIVSYYDRPDSKTDVQLNLKDHVISFTLPENYDSKKTLYIDPFVTNTLNLLGLNVGKAKDVDFDFAGNVYVSGGGTDYNSNNYLAKYDANGNLLWTFEGTLSLPSWNFGSHYGGWVVEKPTGLCYLGQGFNWLEGFQIVRLSTDGIYDGFISTANP